MTRRWHSRNTVQWRRFRPSELGVCAYHSPPTSLALTHTDDNGDDQHDGDQAGAGNKEAGKWRVRFREAERRISELEQQIAAMHQTS
jgi:hypothetical protein